MKYLQIITLLLLTSCSLTSRLPQGEVLYTGVSHIDNHRIDTVDSEVAEAVAQALEVPPNSAFLGSAYRMSLLPIGLWVYNGLYTERDSTLRHWFWQHLKSDPTLVSQVNPQLRAQAAEAVLKDEGYFDASVTFDTLYHPSDSLRAKIGYEVTYRHHSHFGTISWIPSRSARVDSILRHTQHLSYLRTGSRFSSTSLEAEKQRIASTLHDSGYFFFSTDHIRFLADTTRQANTVDLRILVGVGADQRALSPCTIDSVHYRLDYGVGLRSQNHDSLGFVTIGYNGTLGVKPYHLSRSLGILPHDLYSPGSISLAKTLISRLNVFKYTTTELQVLRSAGDTLPNSTLHSQPSTLNPPLSTLHSPLDKDTTSLRLNISAVYAMPWSGTTEIGTVYKDNHQVGPGATLTATRRNLWGGGEKLSFQLTGSYEWYTGNNTSGNKMLNSYELGAKASISVPRLQLPHYFQPSREKPLSSTYSLSFDWLRRGGLFEMIRASGSIEYGFAFDSRNSLTFAPLKLSYVSLVNTTDNYRKIKERYPSLKHAFEDQFIPQMQVSWTFDDASTSAGRRHSHYLNLSVAEAGGIIDVVMGQFGTHRKQGERQLLFQPFSQFLKTTAEYRHLYRINNRFTLASRLQGGIGYAYGNSSEMPYSEMFYIGGPNSLRGFSVRGVGPGASIYTQTGTYDYLNRVGDVKMEGNLELRFPLVGSLHGALFVDAGNVWELHDLGDSDMGGSQPDLLFLRQLALDTGVGFRLDMGMLVLRFDVGVPLHDPNVDTSHYFNCRYAFLRNLGYNLAVGYPF